MLHFSQSDLQQTRWFLLPSEEDCQYSCQKHMKISPSLLHLPVALCTFVSVQSFPENDICCFKGLNHELVKFIILSRHELSSCFGYQGRWRGRGMEVLDFVKVFFMCVHGWSMRSVISVERVVFPWAAKTTLQKHLNLLPFDTLMFSSVVLASPKIQGIVLNRPAYSSWLFFSIVFFQFSSCCFPQAM